VWGFTAWMVGPRPALAQSTSNKHSQKGELLSFMSLSWAGFAVLGWCRVLERGVNRWKPVHFAAAWPLDRSIGSKGVGNSGPRRQLPGVSEDVRGHGSNC